jgi:hypothetical protein
MLPVPFFISAAFGFILSFAVSHPSHPKSFKHKLPHLRIRFIEFSPNIKVKIRSYEIHLHHWFIVSVVFITCSMFPNNILESHLYLQGLLLGVFGQGLTYRDRFSFVHKLYSQNMSYLAFAYTHLYSQKSKKVKAVEENLATA